MNAYAVRVSLGAKEMAFSPADGLNYRAAPTISATDPAIKAAGRPALSAAPPLWVGVAEADAETGVEVPVADASGVDETRGVETVIMVALELGVGVTAFTRTKVLVMVVVA